MCPESRFSWFPSLVLPELFSKAEINNVTKIDIILKLVDDKSANNYRTTEILKQLLITDCEQIKRRKCNRLTTVAILI